MNKPPYLLAAFLCEKVLTEQDGVTSAIRIFDRVFVPYLEKEDPPKSAVALTLLLMFKSGGFKGKATVTISLFAPSGAKRPDTTQEVTFPEQVNGGANIVGNIAFSPKEEGLYWFEILLNGESVTRIPLDVQVLPSLPVTEQLPKP